MQLESHLVYNCDKKSNQLNACRDLKRLVLVGNHSLVASKDIPNVSRDCVPCTYHPMFFRKIKKRLELWSTASEVGTLTPADASGPMVQSTDVGNHKINRFILKPFSMVQAIRLGKKGLLGDPLPPPSLYQVLINVFIPGLSKIAGPYTTHP